MVEEALSLVGQNFEKVVEENFVVRLTECANYEIKKNFNLEKEKMTPAKTKETRRR